MGAKIYRYAAVSGRSLETNVKIVPVRVEPYDGDLSSYLVTLFPENYVNHT